MEQEESKIVSRIVSNEMFVKWLVKKYGQDNIDNIETTEDWFIKEEKEFKKYHPYAGVFVKNLSQKELMEWVNKIRNKWSK